ncbi:MAG: transposase [Promethearchaeota archaeon]
MSGAIKKYRKTCRLVLSQLHAVIDKHGNLRKDKLVEVVAAEEEAKPDWKIYDKVEISLVILRHEIKRLVKRIYYEELEMVNEGKRGRPYKNPPCLIVFGILAKLDESKDYRETAAEINQAFADDLHLSINFTTLWRRIDEIDIRDYLDLYVEMLDLKEVEVAVDSTGLTLNYRGQWLELKHGSGTRKRARWLKFHALVLADSHIPLAFVLTPDNVGDSKVLTELVKMAKRFGFKIVKLYADKAYDVKKIYIFLLMEGIIAAIIPRKNSSTQARGCPYRAELARFMRDYGEDNLRKLLGTKKRLSVERFYWIYKSLFGEQIYSRKPQYIFHEVMTKFFLTQYYLINLYLARANKIQ